MGEKRKVEKGGAARWFVGIYAFLSVFTFPRGGWEGWCACGSLLNKNWKKRKGRNVSLVAIATEGVV